MKKLLLIIVLVFIGSAQPTQGYIRYCYVKSTLDSGVERAHPVVWKIWDNLKGRWTTLYTENKPPDYLICK